LQFNQPVRGRILATFLLLLSKNDMCVLTSNEMALCVDMSVPLKINCISVISYGFHGQFF
jgi:hypothetical protein